MQTQKNTALELFRVRKVCKADLELLHEAALAASEKCQRQLEVLLTLFDMPPTAAQTIGASLEECLHFKAFFRVQLRFS